MMVQGQELEDLTRRGEGEKESCCWDSARVLHSHWGTARQLMSW
jgi:hypothetical protein